VNLRSWISRKLDGIRPYDEAFAEAPTYERARPLTEAGPFVVAGSDLDFGPARVNLIFAVLTNGLADDAKAYERAVAGLYLVPEVER
jgi:hypothetical protein